MVARFHHAVGGAEQLEAELCPALNTVIAAISMQLSINFIQQLCKHLIVEVANYSGKLLHVSNAGNLSQVLPAIWFLIVHLLSSFGGLILTWTLMTASSPYSIQL